MATFTCENNLCAYWKWFNKSKNKCGYNDKIIIGCNGCKCFKPGVYHYINEVWGAMKESNGIPLNNLTYTKEVAIGCFLLTQLFPVKVSTYRHGGWEWMQFYLIEDKEGKNPLKRKDFPSNLNVNKFNEYNIIAAEEGLDIFFKKDFDKAEKEAKNEQLKQEKIDLKYPPRYGWLAPDGEFFEGEFGEHEALARDIVNKKFESHAFLLANRKLREHGGVPFNTMGDFLVDRRWVLIDNPLRYGEDKITRNYKYPLTKAQKEYLYDYLYNRGNKERAKMYLEEDD